jgi:ankyrin repeat protein
MMVKDCPAASLNAVELYKLAAEKNWNKVLQRITEKPDECKYIDPASRFTPLHIVVLGRGSSNSSGRLSSVRAMLVAHPDSAKVHGGADGLTPLHLACMVEDDAPESLEEDLAVVRLILELCPKALNVSSRDGYSPLDIHIIAISNQKRQGDVLSFRRPRKGPRAGTYTAILNTLLEEDLNGGLARPLDLLFECNSLAVLEQLALEEAQASSSKLRARRQARSNGTSLAATFPSPSTNFTNFWVWEWALVLLKSEYRRRNGNYNRPQPPFSALHVAAQVKDCPIPFLMLTMRAYPNQVRAADDSSGNLPLHAIAGWETTDPSSISRKSMALSALVSEYPQATKIRNRSGKTPLSLALETGTSWDNGVRRLTTFSREPSFAIRRGR